MIPANRQFKTVRTIGYFVYTYTFSRGFSDNPEFFARLNIPLKNISIYITGNNRG